MKKLLLIVLLLFPTYSFANVLIDTKIDWYKIKTIRLVKNSWYKLIVWVSEKWESLKSMVDRYGWVSWVNWAYFCPKDYKECNWVNKSYADRISNWHNWSAFPNDTWPDRVIFALDKEQNPFLFQNWHDYSRWKGDEYLVGKTINFDMKWDIYNWIGNHPLLLEDWVNKIWESKSIDIKMKAKNLKNFICASKDGNTIFMWWIENISIYNVPNTLLKLGCHNAINLDSGGSSAMIYDGKYVRWPGRDIMDAWIIIPDKNYPVKTNYINDSDVQKEVINLRDLIKKNYSKLDGLTKKMKLMELSSKFDKLIKTSVWDNKKKYQALKNLVDSYFQ